MPPFSEVYHYEFTAVQFGTYFYHSPMHIHGGPFEVAAVDGETLPVSAWLIHCHIAHHTTNNHTEANGGGGLMMIIDVSG